MTTTTAGARASEIRACWHQCVADYDSGVYDPRVRDHLARETWSDATFANLAVGLRRCLREARSEGFDLPYDWALAREAYDFAPEPLYQYAVLCTLSGLWVDTPPAYRQPAAFGDISARLLNLWGLGQATPRASSASNIRFVTVPFGWDEVVGFAIGGLLADMGIEPTAPLDSAFATIPPSPDPERPLASAVMPFWASMITKALVGHHGMPDVMQSKATFDLVAGIPALQQAFVHRPPVEGHDLTNVLATVTVSFSVAHEVGHLMVRHLQPNWPLGGATDEEISADRLAMRAMWNYPGLTRPFAETGPKQALLWTLAGALFYLVLFVTDHSQSSLSLGTGTTSVEGRSSPKARLQAWSNLALSVASSLGQQGDHESMINIVETARRLLPWIVSHANRYQVHCERVIPTILPLAKDILRSCESVACGSLDVTP